MGVLSVNEAKLAEEFGKQLRAIIEERGDRLVAGAVDEEKLATVAVERLTKALRENRVHAVGRIGGLDADLFLCLEPKEEVA